MNCVICSCPELLTITSMLSIGSTSEEIVLATGVSLKALQEHITSCTIAAPDEDTLATSDLRLAQLAEQAMLCATAAGLSGDTRSQSAALSVSLRIEAERRRRLEIRDEQTQESQSTENVLTIQRLDEMVRAYLARPKSNFCFY